MSQGRSLRLPTALDDDVVASEQKLTDLFAESGQIQSAPKFADWVDRRYNDVLAPLLPSAPTRKAVMSAKFFWFLPTNGDSRSIVGASHASSHHTDS